MENTSRIEYFEKMLENSPDNPTGLLALANEYNKAGRRADEAEALQRYVARHEDEGNAYLRLGDALVHTGHSAEAKDAYEKGIGQAERYGHEGMAGELRGALEALDN